MTITRRQGEGARGNTLSRRPAGSAQIPPSAFRLPPSAMTLVELLVAIAIISILAALLVGVAAAASRTAREARTKQLISRLHTLVVERYDSYRTRRVETREIGDSSAARAILTGQCGFFIADARSAPEPRWPAYVRLAATREQMKLEMPDRWSDILLAVVPSPPAVIDFGTLPSGPLRTRFVSDRSSLTKLYLREYNRVVEYLNSLTPSLSAAEKRNRLLDNQQAECLFLMIMNATADGEARGLFNDSDIADTDGDGAMEFVDGWGNPIGFLRWAPAYQSDVQLSFTGLGSVYRREERKPAGTDASARAAVVAAIEADRDPFDPFRLDGPGPANALDIEASDAAVLSRGWRLTPLVYSGGGDEQVGIRANQTGTPTGVRDHVATVDPYARDASAETGEQRLGEIVDAEAAADDITNHNSGALSRSN